MHEYCGVIHIHSTYSDGTGKIEDIAKAASEAGLDYIVITDHNTLKPKQDGFEKWIEDVMILIGYEVNDINNRNHYIALGTDEVIGAYEVLENGELGCKLQPSEYVKKIKEMGGIGFAAHPDEERHKRGEKSYPWTEWDLKEITGIEIWNHMSEWAEGTDNLLRRFVHPLKTILAPQQKTLNRWDEIAVNRNVTGIGGADAHAFKENLLGLFEVEVFAYKVLFKSIRTYLLLDSPISMNNPETFSADKRKVIDALAGGKCFVANYYHGDASGFRFSSDFKGNIFNMGETINKFERESCALKALIPDKCIVRLIHNGEKIDEFEGNKKIWDVTGAGVYRVECWKGKRGWIFSNHIRIINN